MIYRAMSLPKSNSHLINKLKTILVIRKNNGFSEIIIQNLISKKQQKLANKYQQYSYLLLHCFYIRSKMAS